MTESEGGSRRPIPGPAFEKRLEKLSDKDATRVRVVVFNLLNAKFLPGGDDLDTLIPPSRRLFRRKVPETKLWVFYSFSDTTLKLWDVKEVRWDAGLATEPPED